MEYKKIIATLEGPLTPETLHEYILEMAKKSYDFIKKAIEAIPDNEIECFFNGSIIVSKISCNCSDVGQVEVIFKDEITDKEYIFSSNLNEKFEGKVFVEILPLEKAIDVCHENLDPTTPYIKEIYENLDFKTYLGKYFIREIPETADVIVSADFFEN